MLYRKSHKELCRSITSRGIDPFGPIRLLRERMEKDPTLMRALGMLAISLLDLHQQPNSYETQFVRFSWSVETDPERFRLESYGVQPLSRADPVLQRSAKAANAGGVQRLILDHYLFGSENLMGGPYDFVSDYPLPRLIDIEVRYAQNITFNDRVTLTCITKTTPPRPISMSPGTMQCASRQRDS